MATPTYDPIASTTLASSASSVTFSSLNTIAAGYRDLVLVCVPAGSADLNIFMTFNSDTGNNYTAVRMYGTGSSALSATDSARANIRVSQNALVTTNFGQSYLVNIFDYGATDKHKSVLIRADSPTAGTKAEAARWANTSAITSLGLTTLTADTFAAGSTFSLYGIVA